MSHAVPRMPVLFFGHGNPMNALSSNRYTEAWWRIGSSVPRPKAILSVSAHWYIRGTAVTAAETPETIHDFHGFPPELFAVRYPASGHPELASRVRDLLAPVEPGIDRSRGLDHGTWSVLRHAFPRADVPVVQLGIDATQPAAFHYDLGKRLAPLREEGVLIVGSGNVVHNLGRMNRDPGAPPFDWAERFNERVRDHLAGKDHGPLIDYKRMGEDARLSIPTPDHYLPLLYCIGLQEESERISFVVDGIDLGSIGMLSVVIGGEGLPPVGSSGCSRRPSVPTGPISRRLT
jgi:4,5-DOPA dioxygenase extradiol